MLRPLLLVEGLRPKMVVSTSTRRARAPTRGSSSASVASLVMSAGMNGSTLRMTVVTPASFIRAIAVVAISAALRRCRRCRWSGSRSRRRTPPANGSVERVVARRVLAGLGLGLDPAEDPLLPVQRRRRANSAGLPTSCLPTISTRCASAWSGSGPVRPQVRRGVLDDVPRLGQRAAADADDARRRRAPASTPVSGPGRRPRRTASCR